MEASGVQAGKWYRDRNRTSDNDRSVRRESTAWGNNLEEQDKVALELPRVAHSNHLKHLRIQIRILLLEHHTTRGIFLPVYSPVPGS